MKFYKEFVTSKESDAVHSLINIGSCSLHVLHGSKKTGETATGWGLKKIMKAPYYLLHDSPARREDYASTTGSLLYPFGFSATRYRFTFFSFWNNEHIKTGTFPCDTLTD